MEYQGVVLAGIVFVAAFYVLPYVYRRRHILSQTPLNDGHSDDLRMLNLDDVHVSKSVMVDESHDGVLIDRNGDAMSNSDANKTVEDVRSLARERARRRARVAKREVNRTRGIAGGIVFGVVLVGLWISSFVFSVTFVMPVVASVLCALYGGGLVYVLAQMDRANTADLEAILHLDERLKSARRSMSRKAHRRAAIRVERNRSTISENDASLLSSEMFVGGTSGMPETVIDSAASSTPARNERVSYSSASPAPSYTVKRSEISKREIAPYQPPVSREADVPYRPMKIGERLDVSSVTAQSSLVDGVSSESLAGGSVLDGMLDRRRA